MNKTLGEIASTGDMYDDIIAQANMMKPYYERQMRQEATLQMVIEFLGEIEQYGIIDSIDYKRAGRLKETVKREFGIS